MRKSILFICTLCLFISCNKGSGGPDQVESESYPQDWIFTLEETAGKYTYIQTNLNNMFRKQVDNTYSMVQLAIDENCEFRIAQSMSENHEQCFTIQLEKDRKRWVFANKSTNGQEVHLGCGAGSSEITAPGDSDNYKFHVRRMGKVNGVITVTIESVNFPGYYISSATPGFNYAQNQVVLIKESSPEKATHWLCR